MLPLNGLVVVDFSQFLAGPLASLRLADMGARVIKVERPGVGDLCRRLYISNLAFDGDSTLFHSINRNKESFAANLKDQDDLEKVRNLLKRADVVIQNFRPGVMERLGLDYEAVRAINPKIVYAIVTGYGNDGPWRDKPGQDLLAQSVSGVLWLSGDLDDPPTPMGLAVADMLAGNELAEGILACLVRRGVSGQGGLVEVSLLEAMLDFQFEVFTTHLNDGHQLPARGATHSAHAYLSAPYGVYPTADGHLAIAMTPVPRLGELIGLPAMGEYADPKSWFTHRDAIKSKLAAHLKTESTRHWLDILEPADVWCAEVLDWNRLRDHDGFKAIDMVQQITNATGQSILTTRCPIRIDGQILTSPRGAPKIGQDNARIAADLGL